MFRAALRPRRIALAAAGVAVVGTIPPQEREKLPIYPLPTPEVLLVEESSFLQTHIGVARKAATQAYLDGYAQVQGVVSKWIGIEHAVEHRVKSLVAPNEPLTPALLYVGISALTGSILTRNRGLITRFFVPPLFLVLSLNHFLPATSHNISLYLSDLEDTYFPTLAEKHAIANAHSRMTWERIKDSTENGRSSVRKSAEGAVEWVQGQTGLKIRETLGWGEKVVENKVVETKAEEVIVNKTK
ncbi:hypothetical protein ONZ45_g3283 [Pleurotus djamor]|nr:hypothetical protein ONZ45_g3283 [Pleurotus djamor]